MTSRPPTRPRSARNPGRTPTTAPPTTAEPSANKPPVARPSQPARRSILPRKNPGANWHGQRRIKLEVSLVLALLVMLGLVHAPMQFEQEFTVTVADQEIVEMEEITQTKQVEPPPPPPQPPVPVEVPNDAVLETDIDLNLDATLDINEPLANLPPPPPPPTEEIVEEEEPEDAEIFVAVEEMPVLIGGIEGIAARLRYPEIAQKAGVEGRVFVQFVINKEGRVEDAVVIKGQGGGLDEEALRVVQTARFKPGKQRGKPVKVRMSMPITFRLEDTKQ